MTVRVLRQAPAERLTHHAEVAERGQTAPAVVVAQHHLHRARAKGQRDVVESRHAHVRAERNRRVFSHLGHAFDAVCRVLEVLEVNIT